MAGLFPIPGASHARGGRLIRDEAMKLLERADVLSVSLQVAAEHEVIEGRIEAAAVILAVVEGERLHDAFGELVRREARNVALGERVEDEARHSGDVREPLE